MPIRGLESEKKVNENGEFVWISLETGRTALPYLSLFICLLAWALESVAFAQAPASASSACGSCHAVETVHQIETPMSQATLLSSDNPVFKRHPKLTAHKGAYTYVIETKDGKTTYSVSDGANTVTLPAPFTIGKRMQTWVLERDGRYFESLVSYYPNSDRLDITVGDEQILPSNLDEAVGREIAYKQAKDCFGCHTTNAVVNGKLSFDSLQLGVTCEHCHTGSNTHAFEAVQGVFESIPPHLKNLNAEDINNFCGRCHRSWETAIRTGIRGIPNVRFQPYRLENSRCFDGADRRVTCLACHDPHQNVVREPVVYDKVCLACHVSQPNRVAHAASTAKTCPKGSARCVSCHMPKVEVNTPGGLLTFTDHQIRIARPGEAYPN